MNTEQLVILTEQLKTQRHKTLDKLANLQHELSIQVDDDTEEQVSDLMERELLLSRIQDLEDQLQAIEHALQRVAQGTYGICENCGQTIDPARLEIMPETTLCIHCKTTGEQLMQTKMRSSMSAET